MYFNFPSLGSRPGISLTLMNEISHTTYLLHNGKQLTTSVVLILLSNIELYPAKISVSPSRVRVSERLLLGKRCCAFLGCGDNTRSVEDTSLVVGLVCQMTRYRFFSRKRKIPGFCIVDEADIEKRFIDYQYFSTSIS